MFFHWKKIITSSVCLPNFKFPELSSNKPKFFSYATSGFQSGSDDRNSCSTGRGRVSPQTAWSLGRTPWIRLNQCRHIPLIAGLWLPGTCISVSRSSSGTRTMFTRDSLTGERFRIGLTEIWMRPTHYKGIKRRVDRKETRRQTTNSRLIFEAMGMEWNSSVVHRGDSWWHTEARSFPSRRFTV